MLVYTQVCSFSKSRISVAPKFLSTVSLNSGGPMKASRFILQSCSPAMLLNNDEPPFKYTPILEWIKNKIDYSIYTASQTHFHRSIPRADGSMNTLSIMHGIAHMPCLTQGQANTHYLCHNPPNYSTYKLTWPLDLRRTHLFTMCLCADGCVFEKKIDYFGSLGYGIGGRSCFTAHCSFSLTRGSYMWLARMKTY